MRNIINQVLTFTLVIFVSANLFAQEEPKKETTKETQTKEKKEISVKHETKEKTNHGRGFVDEDGDGYNDNAPDHDGDGIPNGLDPDWQKGKGFIDLDGDGINDNAGFGRGNKNGNKFNKANINARNGLGPQSGNVNGVTNNPDNTGTNGNTRKGQKQKGKG